MCGSCWAVASTSCIESHLAIATNSNLIELSDVNILDCTPNPQYCGGELCFVVMFIYCDCSFGLIMKMIDYIASQEREGVMEPQSNWHGTTLLI